MPRRGDDIILDSTTMLHLTGDGARYGFRGPDQGAEFLLVGDRLTRLPD